MIQAPPLPAKVISGGQTGADRGGLDWAQKRHLPQGGWCPRERRSEDGSIPLHYPLVETPGKAYVQRTKLNVLDSHLTVLVTKSPDLEGGSKKTAEFAQAYGRRLAHLYCPLTVSQILHARQILQQAHEQHESLILNVAGSRESKAPGINKFTQAVLDAIFNQGEGLKMYLDDLRPMPDNFDINPQTAQEAIEWLQVCRISRLSFDHDLGEAGAGTGYDVAKWIERAAHEETLLPISWTIHSANPVGQQNIRQAMNSAERFWEKSPRDH
jgi:hypothetical protein